MPGLLRVNRQIRDEALPMFYASKEFQFKRCHAKYITRWLFDLVQPKHLKFNRAISWTTAPWEKTSYRGPMWEAGKKIYWGNAIRVYSETLQQQTIHLSSVIMLLELGLLGKCKVKMTLDNEPRMHVACTIRELIRKLIARKNLTAFDTWNEKSVPGEDDVAGLSYVVSQEWGRSLPQILQAEGVYALPYAPELYCASCLPVYTQHYRNNSFLYHKILIPWVTRDEGAIYSDEEGGITTRGRWRVISEGV